MMHPSSLFPLRILPLVLLGIAVEIAWYRWVRQQAYPWREFLASVGVLLLRLPSKLVTAAILLPLSGWVWSHRLLTIPLHTGWGLALLFVGEEFAYYWSHRLGHQLRWLWATHSVHHSPEQLHLASAFRLGATEAVSAAWLVYLPLFWLGLAPAAVFAMLGVNLFYQFWLHTEIIGRLGPIEFWLNTPSHHRVHHARNKAYLDRNYGGILIIWDRIFGSFAALRDDVPPDYGLVGKALSYNPLRLAFQEWAALLTDVSKAPSWSARFALAAGRPGQLPARAPMQHCDSA